MKKTRILIFTILIIGLMTITSIIANATEGGLIRVQNTTPTNNSSYTNITTPPTGITIQSNTNITNTTTQICSAGYFCSGNYKQYKNRTCQLINQTYCANGCSGGACNQAPTTQTNTTTNSTAFSCANFNEKDCLKNSNKCVPQYSKQRFFFGMFTKNKFTKCSGKVINVNNTNPANTLPQSTSNEIKESCTDSDLTTYPNNKGIDATKFGSITYKNQAGKVYIYNDTCIMDKVLNEVYCDRVNVKNANIECKEKCLNGVCVGGIVTGCRDSDGGHNNTIKGIVSVKDNNGILDRMYEDKCYTENALGEYFCKPNNDIGLNYTLCNNASKCENGACITK